MGRRRQEGQVIVDLDGQPGGQECVPGRTVISSRPTEEWGRLFFG